MDLAVVALVVSVVSAVAVVASAVFFHRQARAARQSANAASLQTAAEMVQRLDRVFVDHPSLWGVFFEGQPEDSLDARDRHRLVPVAEAYLSTWEFLVDIPGWGTSTNRLRWREHATQDFADSPFLCDYLRSKAAAFPPELLELAAAGERRRNGRQTPPTQTPPTQAPPTQARSTA